MEILNQIFLLLTSIRAQAIYWNAFYILAAGIVNIVLENVANLGLPAWAVVFVGIILTQISKGIQNKSLGRASGWIDN